MRRADAMRFSESVYEMVRRIPPGRVATYGEIAAACGSPGAARAVGAILHRNPAPGIIPCHRVVDRRGRLARGFAFGGRDGQALLLRGEGVRTDGKRVLDFNDVRLRVPCQTEGDEGRPPQRAT